MKPARRTKRNSTATKAQMGHEADDAMTEGKVEESLKECNSPSISMGVKNTIKRPRGQRCYAAGPGDPVLAETDHNYFACRVASTRCPQIPENDSVSNTQCPEIPENDSVAYPLCPHFAEKDTISPSPSLGAALTLEPSAKIKLQLFPIDEDTRRGLEKDGYHPYLELTLRVRKKVSSILKHLTGKWGTSKVALGEPVLFPYDVSLDNKGSPKKWTSNDAEANAGDVYAAIGMPAIFRLRYGWVCNHAPNSLGISSTSTPSKACTKSEEVQDGGKTHLDIKQFDGTNIESHLNKVTEKANGVMPEAKSLDASADALRPMQWDDSLTNVSIGGLFTEASLQGMLNSCDSKANQSNWGLPSTQLISDSLDAFLTSQVNRSQGSMQASQDSHLSILDGDQTCHAFSFQKTSPLSKKSRAINGRSNCESSILDKASEPLNCQVGDHHKEATTNLTISSQVYNDDSSLGLRNILWNDSSLGPFDLGP